jgi:hypothetical protein
MGLRKHHVLLLLLLLVAWTCSRWAVVGAPPEVRRASLSGKKVFPLSFRYPLQLQERIARPAHHDKGLTPAVLASSVPARSWPFVSPARTGPGNVLYLLMALRR